MQTICKKTFIITSLFLAALCAPLFSQDAEKLEALLSTPAVSWSQAAAFVLEAADKPAGDPARAFSFAMDQNWLPKNSSAGDNARLGGVALLLMHSFDLKGGIFYSLFKGPHHAFRELVYKEVIRGGDPGAAVSGRELLLMTGRILTTIEAEQGAQ
jgi:hypothetical protein